MKLWVYTLSSPNTLKPFPSCWIFKFLYIGFQNTKENGLCFKMFVNVSIRSHYLCLSRTYHNNGEIWKKGKPTTIICKEGASASEIYMCSAELLSNSGWQEGDVDWKSMWGRVTSPTPFSPNKKPDRKVFNHPLTNSFF